MPPSAKRFFQKLGSDTKAFFRKGGPADTGLRKFGNTLSKVGGVAQSLAPLAAVVAPEFAIPLMAGGALGKVVGGTANAVRKGVQKGKGIEAKTQGAISALTSGIEAGKPLTGELGMNFA